MIAKSSRKALVVFERDRSDGSGLAWIDWESVVVEGFRESPVKWGLVLVFL